WMALFLIAFTAAGVLGCLHFAWARGGRSLWTRRGFLAAGAATLVIALFAGPKYREYHFAERVVLISDMTAVRSGPGVKFNELERFRAGTILTRLPYDDGAWTEVRLPDGRKGFVENSAVERL
ncbi:MAG: hypothetical protein N2111_13725, partial [Candidatus Sumerlaeaceae bacterium]|nr:hypothetical protein [Candidatus Sumerlaeaceae bacterium]